MKIPYGVHIQIPIYWKKKIFNIELIGIPELLDELGGPRILSIVVIIIFLPIATIIKIINGDIASYD